tara:strand:- start:3 stop:392 length:390 start_codon:yes stop_codon:yes gene_type:complete
MEDMAFSEYNVFNVSVQLKLEALDFSFPECGDSVFGIFRADTSELGVACVGSAYLSEVIKFVPQDMQKESSGLTGSSHVGQDFMFSSSFRSSKEGGSGEISLESSNALPHNPQNRSEASDTNPHCEHNF